ncbi:MAG: curli production assembly protein CsgG, partial [Deltaproteobacteria bacterium]|nr:curli production assembly protein CsgG [Deltaproteobacteria bacterium]
MKSILFSVIFSFVFLQSCVTVDKHVVKTIDTKPQISKALVEMPQKYLKRKVAIGRFTNETKYGRNFFAEVKDEKIGKQASDILAGKLAATNKFILLERSDIEKTLSEMKIKIARNELSDLYMSADYLIIGSVSEFGRKTVDEVGVFSRTKKQVASCKVTIRM